MWRAADGAPPSPPLFLFLNLGVFFFLFTYLVLLFVLPCFFFHFFWG